MLTGNGPQARPCATAKDYRTNGQIAPRSIIPSSNLVRAIDIRSQTPAAVQLLYMPPSASANFCRIAG